MFFKKIVLDAASHNICYQTFTKRAY